MMQRIVLLSVLLSYMAMVVFPYRGLLSFTNFWLISIIFTSVPFVSYFIGQDSIWKRRIYRIAMTFLGISFVFFSANIFYFGLSYFWEVDLLVLFGISFTLSVAGIVNAMLLFTKTIKLKTNKLERPRSFVHLSDLHIGSRGRKLLARVVKKTNALNPDFVCITGDLIDIGSIPLGYLNTLGDIKAPVFYVIGNHERYVDLEEIIERLKQLKINVLRNERLLFKDIQIFGIDDSSKKDQVGRVFPKLPHNKEKFSLLLYHKPFELEFLKNSQIDLALVGHTHHGQIWPFNFVVKLVFRYIAGLYSLEDSHLYVSPGTGTWGPILRLGSKNLITKFCLEV